MDITLALHVRNSEVLEFIFIKSQFHQLCNGIWSVLPTNVVKMKVDKSWLVTLLPWNPPKWWKNCFVLLLSVFGFLPLIPRSSFVIWMKSQFSIVALWNEKTSIEIIKRCTLISRRINLKSGDLSTRPKTEHRQYFH